MIHHKDFPFDKREEENEIVHLAPGVKHQSSTLSKVIITLVFIGMVGLSIKALYDFGRGEDSSSIKVIEANPEPYKVRPEDPGGMEIPHADKEIYEHLKMPIEEPIDIFAEQEQSIQKLAALQAAEASAIPKAPKTPMPEVVRPKKPEPKIITILPSGEAKIAPSNSVNLSSNESAGSKKIDVNKLLAKKSAPEIWLQLGTFKSEQEATRAWQDVKEKNSDILKDIGTKVTKSDLGPQGIIYRLQSGPVNSEEDAKKLCTKLNDRKLSCFHTTNKTTP